MLADLDTWVTYWKNRFRLNDWKITARLGRPVYVDENKVRSTCLGLTTWNPGEMTANITLSAKADNRTLCHEILHIVLEGEDDCKGYNAAIERRIERIVDCVFFSEPVLPTS